MAERAQELDHKSASKGMAIVQELLHDYHPRNFAVEFWDGSRWDGEPGQFCRFNWHIHHPGVLRSLLRSDRQVALGEAFIYGDFDISGDILAIFPIAEYLEDKHFGPTKKLHFATQLLGLPTKLHGEAARAELHGRTHSKSRDREAVRFHYDLSNEFYQLWLDPAMVYSCAYFKSVVVSLYCAQVQKMDYFCR